MKAVYALPASCIKRLCTIKGGRVCVRASVRPVIMRWLPRLRTKWHQGWGLHTRCTPNQFISGSTQQTQRERERWLRTLVHLTSEHTRPRVAVSSRIFTREVSYRMTCCCVSFRAECVSVTYVCAQNTFFFLFRRLLQIRFVHPASPAASAVVSLPRQTKTQQGALVLSFNPLEESVISIEVLPPYPTKSCEDWRHCVASFSFFSLRGKTFGEICLWHKVAEVVS